MFHPVLDCAGRELVLDRALVSIRDIMGVMWLIKRRRLPGSVTEV